MSFVESIQSAIKKYFVWKGRASRSEFWWFVLFVSLGSIVVTIIDIMILGYPIEVNGPMYLIFLVAMFIPSIAVTARRLHDVNRSGWWQLIELTIIGILLIIIWNATEGEKKKNIYGPPIKIKS